MNFLLKLFRIFLAFTGFYPQSLVEGAWYIRKGNVAAKCLLTAFTFFLVIQDILNFRQIVTSQVPQGGGGPIVPFSLQLYPTIVHLAVTFLRLYVPPDVRPLLKQMSHLGGRSEFRVFLRVYIYLFACLLQLSNTVYTAINFPTAIDRDNETFYTLNNWPNVLIKIAGIVWAGIPVLDLLALGVMLFLGWVEGVLGSICKGVSLHKTSKSVTP